MAKISLFFLLVVFLTSCFGPLKEIKYQIEDSSDLEDDFIDNPLPLNDFSNKFEIQILDTFKFSSETKRNFAQFISDNFFYYASHEGLISGYNLLNKDIEFSYKYHRNITAGLSSDSKNLYFVDSDGYLCALSLNNSIEWKTFVGEVLAPPYLISNRVIIKTTNNKFISLNKLDGSIYWTFQAINSPLTIKSWGEINSIDNYLYAGISSGKILAINSSNGSMVWETTYSQPNGISDIENSNDTTSMPIVDDSVVYVVSSKGNIAALSRNDGQVLWKRALSSFLGMTSNDDTLFITHNTGVIYALSKETGKVLWRNADLKGRDTSRPFVFNENLIVSDYQGYLHFLNIKTGSIESRIKLSDSLLSYPLYDSNNESFWISSIEGDLFHVGKLSIAKNINDKKNENYDGSTEPKELDDSVLDKIFFWD